MWWFLGALIGAITIIHLGNVLLSKKRTDELASKKPSVQRGKDEEDTAPSRPYTTPSIRRVPQAALTAWRVVLYRLTFPILNMNLAELLFTMAYFGAILIWALVRSESNSKRPYPLKPILSPRQRRGTSILGQSSGCSSHLPSSLDYRFGGEE
jgi:hypothetical protein